MQTITLEDIRREANDLEFNVTVTPNNGRLRIAQRSDTALFYQSQQPLDDPRVLPDAWAWLLRCRANFDQLDEARTSIATRSKPARQGNTFVIALLFVAHFLPAIAIGAGLHMLTRKLYIGYGSFILLLLVTWLMMRRLYASKK